jgi:hypothetical protein
MVRGCYNIFIINKYKSMRIEPGTSPKHRYELIKATLLVIIGALITITVVYGIEYFTPKDAPEVIEPVASIPESTPIAEELVSEPSPTLETTKEKVYSQEELNTIFEMDKKSTDTKLYYSEKLGVGFTYRLLEELIPYNLFDISAIEKVNGVALGYYQKGEPKPDWINLEVFTKDPKDTLEQAITKEFLQGVDPKKCFAQKYTDGDSSGKQLQGYNYAEIFYPVPTNGDVWFGGINNCPEKVQFYASTNAVQFFLEDTKVPSKYVFVRIGQESIASSGIGNEGWERSIRILK